MPNIGPRKKLGPQGPKVSVKKIEEKPKAILGYVCAEQKEKGVIVGRVQDETNL